MQSSYFQRLLVVNEFILHVRYHAYKIPYKRDKAEIWLTLMQDGTKLQTDHSDRSKKG